MIPARTVVIVALGLSLAACASTGGPVVDPPVAAAWRGTDAAPSLAGPRDWWTAFDDPTLTALETAALAQNLDLAAAVARREQAAAGARAAQAGRAPFAVGTGQAARARQSLETGTARAAQASPQFERTVSSYDASLAASWEIDLFGGLRSASAAARADLAAADAGVAAARLLIAADVAEAYVRLRSLQERQALARRQVELAETTVRLAAARYAAGQAPRRDLDAAQGTLAQVQAGLPGLAAGIEAQMNRLAVLTGRTVQSARGDLETPAPPPAAPAFAVGAPSDLMRRRPDLVIAERRLAAADARVGASLSEYFPKITLQGLIGSQALGASAMFTGDAVVRQAAVGLRWRLFDFARVDAEVDAARGRKAEALAAYRQAVLRAGEDVENALQARLRAGGEAAAQARASEAFERQRRAASDAYRAGAGALGELVDADRQLVAARDRVAQARADAALAEIALIKALGG